MVRPGLMTKRQKNDPFEPQPRYEETGIARYWPDTLFVDISEYPHEVQSFDGDELRLTTEANLDVLIALAARMHEQVHWLQSAGTTFGRFLSLNRVTTADLAEAILTTVRPAELATLEDVRHLGRAPAARTKQGQLTHKLGYSVTIQSLFDHWWASVAVEHFLTDNNTTLPGVVDPRFLVGLALKYVTAGDAIRTVFNSPDEDFLETMINCGPIGRFPGMKALRNISVRHIEEAAALTVQHLFNSRVAASLPHDRYIIFGSRVSAWTANVSSISVITCTRERWNCSQRAPHQWMICEASNCSF
jgi:hypothetical protein